MVGHLLIGLLACTVMIGFLLRKGRKNDWVSLIAVMVGVVAVMLIATHWDAVAHLLPFSSPVHAAPTFTTHLQTHTSAGIASVHHATRAIRTPSQQRAVQGNQLFPVLTILGSVGITLFVGLIVVVGTIGVLLVRRQSNRVRTWQVCPECLEDREVQDYRWRDGAARVTGRLCQECAVALGAVSLTSR